MGLTSSVAPRRRSPLTFFVLVFALSIPFVVIGEAMRLQLLPGLPISALMVVCPAIAAAILVHRERGTRGVRALLKRAVDFPCIPPRIWYAPAVLLVPVVTLVAYGLMRAMRLPLPTPQLPAPAAIATLSLALLVAAVAEEVGWSGYAIDALQERATALGAAILLGLVWGVWHVVPLLQTHRSAAWIGWWGLGTVAGRVLVTWIYDNAGKSVFAAALYHAVSNLCWQLFPNRGSHWDPRFTGAILAVVAAIVTVAWGPRTLTRSRTAAHMGRAA